jgi:hypothetical protein
LRQAYATGRINQVVCARFVGGGVGGGGGGVGHHRDDDDDDDRPGSKCVGGRGESNPLAVQHDQHRLEQASTASQVIVVAIARLRSRARTNRIRRPVSRLMCVSEARRVAHRVVRYTTALTAHHQDPCGATTAIGDGGDTVDSDARRAAEAGHRDSLRRLRRRTAAAAEVAEAERAANSGTDSD